MAGHWLGWLGSIVLGFAGLIATARSADFPPADQLPSRAELPELLVDFSGRRVASPDQWRNLRRPQLKALFEHYMYGKAPPAPLTIRARLEREDRNYFDGRAIKREIAIAFGPAGVAPLQLLLVIPQNRSGRAAVFLGMNFCGNHAVLEDPTIPLSRNWMYPNCTGCVDHRATDAARGKQRATWSIRETIDHGYAVATCHNGDIDPDRPVFEEGIHRHYLKPGATGPAKHDWGTIAAWAFGLQRAVDYLVQDPDIDATKIAVLGHSRLGKTALLAGAFDERIALVIAHQAGCGGSAPSRGVVGESVRQINDRFPHWFCGAFKDFNGRPDRLPFDQHGLVALCAPRPVLFTNAVADTWANPDGQFAVLRAADPVYRFLGVSGLKSETRPAVNQLSAGRLGYWIRPGKHSMGPEDWKIFLAFADAHFGKPRP